MVRETPNWKTVPRDARSEIVRARRCHYIHVRQRSRHDYLRQLQKSVDANRKSAHVKVPANGLAQRAGQKTEKGKVLQADRKFIQQVSKAFDEAKKAKKIALPEGHDWQRPIFDAVLRQPIAPTDRQEVITRVGVTMLDKISKYNKLKGPFVPWFTKELNNAARTATEDYKAETAGQIPGNVSINAPISDDATRADDIKDTKEVLGQGLYQTENRRLVTRSRAMSMLDREWDKPLTRATLRG